MLFSNDPQVEIKRFFSPPGTSFPGGKRSCLSLLRRDLEQLYGKEDAEPSSVRVPLLTSLGVMTGIELLGKLWSGEHGAPVSIIEEFLEKVMRVPKDDAQAIAQFRDALAHGYRLGTKRRKNGRDYSFAVSDAKGEDYFVKQSGEIHMVNLWGLKRLLLDSIETYRQILESDGDLIGKFMVCQANLGEVQVDEQGTV